MVDNSISKCCVTHSSYMDSCNSLYNNMKNNEKISHLIVGLLVEFKQIINSKDEKHFIVDNLSKIVDNYKNLFTNMKDNNIINLTEPSKKSPTESNKSKISIYEQKTRFPVNKIINIKRNKTKSCGFL